MKADLKTGKTYELVIFEWRAAVPREWKLEFNFKGGPWQSAAVALELHCGDQLRSNGGPEQEYLAAMLEHGYLKAVTSGE